MEWNLEDESKLSPKPTISIPVNDDTFIFIDEIIGENWFYLRMENLNGRIIFTPKVDGIEGIIKIVGPIVDDLLSRGVTIDRIVNRDSD